MGVLLNCTSLSRLLSLSSAFVVCLQAKTESALLKREKDFLLLAIGRTDSAALEELYREADLLQSVTEEAPVDIVDSSSERVRDISRFSRVLHRRIVAKMDNEDGNPINPPNLLCSPKVVEYLEVYILPLALLWSGLLLGNDNNKTLQSWKYNTYISTIIASKFTF